MKVRHNHILNWGWQPRRELDMQLSIINYAIKTLSCYSRAMSVGHSTQQDTSARVMKVHSSSAGLCRIAKTPVWNSYAIIYKTTESQLMNETLQRAADLVTILQSWIICAQLKTNLFRSPKGHREDMKCGTEM